MTKVLFICHGNICRSPIAEFVLKDMVRKAGREDAFEIASAATSAEEIGNPVYPPAKRILKEHGISCEGKQACRMRAQDYTYYDYILCMERYNISNLKRIVPEDYDHKIKRLLDYTDHPKDIDDPWYSGDFETAYREIEEGCKAFLQTITK